MDIFKIIEKAQEGFNSSSRLIIDIGLPCTIKNYKQLKIIMLQYGCIPATRKGKNGYLIDVMDIRYKLAQEIIELCRK